MSETTTISKTSLPRVRESLYTLVANICETADQAAGDRHRETDPSPYIEIRSRLAAAWFLLDDIGWTALDNSAAVRVDVARHGEALLAAVETMLPMMTVWLRELADHDPGKPERVEEYLILQRLGALVRQR
ncbi:MAG TPA: hypothetical protein VH081_07855 [Solirubrobacteraceae bacterium]|jgi:hypothetical protein|nr:hypothetical protein [Solirubrobacteraceae bacterium]